MIEAMDIEGVEGPMERGHRAQPGARPLLETARSSAFCEY
jgi:hypothetical protein